MDPFQFLVIGYFLSVLIELPILLLGLSRHHAIKSKIFAGFWLTACTYPIVILVLPPIIYAPYGRLAYLFVAETFAPVAECLLFRFMFAGTVRWRDYFAIFTANVASFLLGEFVIANYFV